MEAETTEKSVESQDEIAAMLNVCASCKEGFQNKEPKLLACLHTVCGSCLPNLTVGETTSGGSDHGCQLTKCPVCSNEDAENTVITNLYATSEAVPPSSTEGAEDSKEDTKVCTGCEESASATSYCTECEEYLCDQCVQAHRRVKVTKDHTIQPKDSVASSPKVDRSRKQMMCPVHKQEELKLYCETCEKLTCRDCQLLEHKDHQYQFVDEAAIQYKEYLTALLEKIREKKVYVENAKTLIGSRNEEIVEKEQKVASDIKTFIMKVATELNKRGKQLMLDLQSICKAKKGQLEKKNKEIQDLSSTLNHSLKFAEFCLDKGNNAALLYTKKLVNGQLKGVLKTKCEIPNPYHIIDMKFGYDPKTPLIQIPTLGSIFVEGLPFNHSSPPSQTTPPASQNATAGQNTQSASISGGSSQNPAAVSHPSAGSSGHMSKPPQSQSASASNKIMPEDMNVSNMNSGQKQAFLMTLRKMQEQQELRRQQQQQQQQYMKQQQNMYKNVQQSTSPSSSTHLQMMSQMQQQHPQAHTQRLSHLPPQSSYISSSNSQNQRQQNYYPPQLKGPHPIQSMHIQQQQQQQQVQQQRRDVENLIKINLSQLQERRAHAGYHPSQSLPQGAMYAQNSHSQTTNMQNPIVIQPTPDYSPERLPDSAMAMANQMTSQALLNSPGIGTLSDCMHSNRQSASDVRSMKPEERSSCSFANSNNNNNDIANKLRLKAEPKTAALQEFEAALSLSTRSHSSGSRTPTPRAESTTRIPTPTQGFLNIIPDIDDFSNINTNENVGDALSAILGSDLTSSAASEKVLETILGLNLDKPESSQSSDRKRPKNNQKGEKRQDKSGKLITGKTKMATRENSVRASNHADDDPSEDWCAVCHNGGDLLCCDGCPKVFHLTCHIPILGQAPSEDWFCGLCIKDDKLRLEAADLKDEGAGPGLTDKERLVCERILLELFSHDDTLSFQEPVSSEVPNYYKIISNPMDMATIREKLASAMYKTLVDFLKDLQLIFSNCAVYNLPDSNVGMAGKKVEDFFHKQLERYVPYVKPEDLLPLGEDSEPTLTDSQMSTSPAPKKRRGKSQESDDEWVAEETQEEESEDFIPKKRLKRKRDGHSSESSGSSEESVVHVR